MPTVLFVFLGWGYWALRYENQTPIQALIATLCILAFLVGLLWVWLAGATGFGFCVLTVMVYWFAGARLWTQLLSGRQPMYPGLVLEHSVQ